MLALDQSKGVFIFCSLFHTFIHTFVRSEIEERRKASFRMQQKSHWANEKD